MLWNILINDLLCLNLPPNCYLQAFADDIVLMVQHHDIDCCINRTNIILKWILNFGNRTSLKFNAQKTKAMIISSKRNIDQQQIVLGDDHVDVVDVFKYLGVSIHKKLNWTTHIESVSKKALFLYHQLRKCYGNTWGLSFDVLKHIYIMAIEPIMLFACSIWGNKVNKKCITKLRSVQRNFVLSMIRGYKTISFDAAFVIADILPIDLRIQYLNHIYILRTNGVFLGLRCQLKVPISSLNHPASTILRANCNDNHDFIIFTDGSKINGHLGSSFVVYKNIDEDPIFQAKFRLANYCTVYQAEQFAIERAAFWLKDKQSTAIIYTDSLSTVNAINNRWNTDYLIHQIRTWIKDNHICIKWIRGHQQNIGNELADKLAKEATTMNNITFFFCPFNYLKKIIRWITTIKWNRLWLSSNNGRVTRLFFPTIFHRRNSNLSPDYVITQFISNHGDFRGYLYRINRANDPYCNCGALEDSIHLIFHCQNFSFLRILINFGNNFNLSNFFKNNYDIFINFLYLLFLFK
ncbi:uncharacterized protein LOC142646148 [Dermatophagoides pteronyssinus]|uniref:uncharacterized protein LOC142646148 n=1 Tax=Dermatophagoides pteronyssinus TaxID=6956 RepID=UPI003F67F5A7